MFKIRVAHFINKGDFRIRKVRVTTKFKFLSKIELKIRGYNPYIILAVETIYNYKSEVDNL